ncbi:unnamed protein product [Paramecium sonneborni]|uniref:Extradiol ring-cleavage dioxygenase class III enzyme subunit B domain-containing protein n=1 Tax=Paramecium sonneborni TaxID=65129 RepID=A0A8S1KPA4_9CILI|nr:unnamed protein product [Paramecium sonneborni]
MFQTVLSLPVIFFGHGSPMNGIEVNVFSLKWKELGRTLPKPNSILAVSAHWETDGIKLTGNKIQKTIHDFGGFPKKLYEQQYNPPGNLNLCERIQKLIPEAKIDNTWGLDHGTWTILKQMYPEQDIPVIQLSLSKRLSEGEHYNIGKILAPLRKEGVMIIGSGNIIHSFKEMEWTETAKPRSWAAQFNESVKDMILKKEHDKLINYKKLEYGLRASPTPEHYLPFLYVLGLQESTDKVTFFNDEVVMASFSMTSFILSS